MISMLGRVFATLRVWLGLNDPSENRLHQAHGWLLLPAAEVRARAVATHAVAGLAALSGNRRD